MAEPRWLRIGDICSIEKGVTGLAAATPGEYPLVATGAERRSAQTYQFDTPAVCIPLVSSTGHGKKTLNYVHFQDGKFALGTILAALIPKDKKALDARYLHTYLQMNKDRVLVPLMRGAANVSLSVSAISDINIPVPSLAEQKKALAKLDSMSGEHAELLLETDKQLELLKQLRLQILQDAIEGKLTADWRKKNPALITGENHASKLLEKIKSEKSRLIQQGKLKKEKPLPPITEAKKPFPLPEGWVWCRLDGDIAHVSTGATPLTSHKEYYDGRTLNWVTSSATNDLFIRSSEKLITEKALRETNCKIFPVGTLIIAMYGQGKTRGQISELNISAATNQACAALELYYYNETLKRYLKVFFLQQYDKLRALAFGGLQPNLNLTKIGETMIPLPPYEEQKRILVGVDNAMNRLDGLEKQCTERQSQSKMLMQSVLREAFETPVAENKHPYTKEQ